MFAVSSQSTPDKLPEPNQEIVKMLLESIILLCQRRNVREELRRRKAYPVVRNLDYLQENEAVSELIYEIVNLLMRDEGYEQEQLEQGQGPPSSSRELALV